MNKDQIQEPEVQLQEQQTIDKPKSLFEDILVSDAPLEGILERPKYVSDEELKTKAWGEGFVGGAAVINVKGRPKNVEKKSNKELRMSAMMNLVRMLRPHLNKSVMAASRIIEDRESSDSNKLKAASFLVSMYKDTLKEAYNEKYDTDEGESITKDNSPVFSLKMIEVDSGS